MQRRPYRSLLFIPGTKPVWIASAPQLGADAYVLDLEDAVPEEAKASARSNVAAAISTLAGEGVGVFVRVNALDTPHWLADLCAVVRPGLTGIALPKVSEPGDVIAVDRVLTALEARAGLAVGEVDIQPLLETARGIENAFEILSSSRRVRSFFGGSARDGDVSREVGFRWTAEGKETLYIRSKLVVDGRAAGVPYPIAGTWVDVDDTEGLKVYACENRDLGYTGMYTIHPTHVAVANQAFTPTESEIRYFRRIVAEVDRAKASGEGALLLDGVMLDHAMVVRAHEFLAMADTLGVSETTQGGVDGDRG